MEIAIWVLSIATIIGWFLFLMTASLLKIEHELIDVYKKTVAVWKSSSLSYKEQCDKWEKYSQVVRESDKLMLREIERTEQEIQKLRKEHTN